MRRFQIGWVVACGLLAGVVHAQDADSARQLLRQGQAPQAAAAYSALIERSPTDPDLWLGRGLAQARQGLWAAALADLEKTVALAPGYADAWSALADVYRWSDRPAAAAEAYARLAQLRPDDAQVQVLRARSLLAAGDAVAARAAAQRARALGASADSLPAIPDPAVPAPSAPGVAAPLAATAATPTSAPEAAVQPYRWALSGGLYRTASGAANANENSLSLRHYGHWGSIAVERLGLQRFGYSDQALALDAYPRLWQGAYANLRYQRTTAPELYPERSWRAELYQNVGAGWELAVSRDMLGFGSGVRIDGVSAGKYWGNFFARWRHQQVKSGSSSGAGDRLFVRYYYEGDADHYVEANVSSGRSDDFSSALIRSSRSDSRGLVWYHFVTRDWGFKLSASESNDSSGSGQKARDLGIGLTRRW